MKVENLFLTFKSRDLPTLTYSLLIGDRSRKEGRMEGGREGERERGRVEETTSKQWASLKDYKYLVILITSH